MKNWRSVGVVLLVGILFLLAVFGQLDEVSVVDGAYVDVLETNKVYIPAVMGSDNNLASAQFANCRIGANAWGPFYLSPEFDLFNFGTYVNYSVYPFSGLDNLEHWPLISVSQDRDTTGAYLDSYTIRPTWSTLKSSLQLFPGALWIVGNEPDREYAQDDTYPAMYARIYHDVYTFIKSNDPSARVGVAGLVGFTAGREQYMQIVWDTYKSLYGTSMSADAWTIHPYVLWESGGSGAHVALGTDPALAIPYNANCNDPTSICLAEHDDIDLFAEMIVRMRQWMWRHGQQNKPLLVTEWGIILPSDYIDENGQDFDAARVSDYMRTTQDYFRNAVDTTIGLPVDDYRLVQQWLWFPLGISGNSSSSSARLVEQEAPYNSTDVGKAWQQYVTAIPPLGDIRVQAHNAFMMTPTTSVKLTATLYNVGNVSTSGPITVAFYSSSTTPVPFDTVNIEVVQGCLWGGQKVTATWEKNWTPGLYPYWIRISASDETINIGPESVGWVRIMAPNQVLFLPMVQLGKMR